MSDLIERIAALSPQKRELLLQRLNQKKESVSLEKILPQSRESNTFPLSFAQQRLWFFEQLTPGNFTYHIVAGVRLTGTLEARSLDRSLNELVKRHEVLRTAFKTINGQPVQAIASNLEFKILEIDLRSLPETERDREVERLIAAEAKLAFDLSQAPLLRAKLLQLSDSNWVLLLSTHHIISDAWSVGIFIQELATFYQAFCTGKPSALPELSVQYADFASWQRQWLQGEVLETQLAYWKKQLGGNLSVLNLPTDRPRSAVQTFRGAVHKFTIPKAIAEEIAQLSQREKATLFMTLLAAFKTLLYRYTGQEDILVGSPIANRNRREIEELIGFFANTVVFRTNLSSNPTFKELLGRVREVALGAYNHQDLPFEKLVEILQPERDLSHNPLFQVFFSLRNVPTSQIKLPGVTLSSLEIERKTARVDLALDLEEGLEGINGTLEYSQDLFDASTARRIAGHFLTLLESIAANPEQRLSNLPILTKPEQQQLLFEWNNTQSELPKNQCVHGLFEAQTERTPDAIAVVFDGEHLTYRELNRRANQLAHHLKSLGVKPEIPVGICVDRSLEMVVGLLGILKAGGAYVPLDPAYPPERLVFMLEDAEVAVLLTQALLVESLPKHQGRIVCLDTDWEIIERQSEANLISEVKLDNLAYVIYTSGSTGTPKGVLGTHRGTVNRCFWNPYPFIEEDICCQKTSLNFVDSVWEIFAPLLHGLPTVIIPDRAVKDINQFLQTLSNQNVTRLVLVPSLLRVILDSFPDLDRRLPQLKYWICSGETLPMELGQQFREQMPQRVLINLYGSSEVAADVTWYDATHCVEKVPIGRPIANTQIYLLDRNLQPVPIGIPGDIYVGGDGLAQGYLNRPDLTSEKFISNPFGQEKLDFLGNYHQKVLFKTGDIGCYRPDGNIEFLGRGDCQIKIRGFRIELGEIEAALSQHSSVSTAAVLLQENEPGPQRLVAYLVPNSWFRNQHPELISELRSFLKHKLPDYMVPSAFVLLDALPLTPNGKIDRLALSQRCDYVSDETAFTEPQTPTEKEIAEIWTALLGLEKVGTNQNFFDLGGHSLMATQLISRVRSCFGVELALCDFFAEPTIQNLAELVEEEILANADSNQIDEWLDLLEKSDGESAQTVMLTE